MSATTLRPAGERAVLVEVADADHVWALRRRLAELVGQRDGVWAHVTDVVPAATTVLVVLGEGGDLAGLRAELTAAAEALPAAEAGDVADPADTGTRRLVEIPVTYDGPDLESVASATGMGPQDVVEAHTGMPWRVAFGGFAPGFAYLTGGNARLVVPRLETPRRTVPAGSVGLAGPYSGVYPAASPGGWQIIGHTDAVLWDVERDPPAMLRPGDLVRFVEAGS